MGQIDELYGEVEVADKGAENGDLGGVFLAEEGEIRLDDVEELGDDGGDAAEVRGAGAAVEAGADFGDVDPGAAGAVGVHVGGGGGEEEVHAFGLEEPAVGFPGAGVFGQIFVRGELGGVDEEGDGDEIALCFGGADQGDVAGVEGAHGGHEAKSASRPCLFAQSAEGGAGFGDRFADLQIGWDPGLGRAHRRLPVGSPSSAAATLAGRW